MEQRQIDIKVSNVFRKIQDAIKAGYRVIVNEGGARSTKTISSAETIINLGLKHPDWFFTIGRAKLTWLKDTALKDFFWCLNEQYGLYNQKHFNKTESNYFLNGHTEFGFVGLDEPQKAHGRKQNVLWLNEAMEIKQADYDQLIMRTTDLVLIDYNPSAESHWIFDSVIPREDCAFIKSTYLDNPFLQKAIIDEIEKYEPTDYNLSIGTANDVLWKIYGLGERAAHRGLIFPDMKVIRQLPPKEEWKKSFYGLDFGYTNDPSVLMHIVLSQGQLYWDQVFYERKLTNIRNPLAPEQASIQQRFEENCIDKKLTIWADSAEPKSITDLQNCGYNVRSAPKGKDSIVSGIENLHRYKINLTERSIDTIKEKNNYKWFEDRDGKTHNKPVDAFNHSMDAGRYGVSGGLPYIGDKKAARFPGEKSTRQTFGDKVKLLSRSKNNEGYNY